MTDATHPFDALMDITARPPVVFVRGAGAYLWDDTASAISTSCRAGPSIASAIRRLPLPTRSPRRQNCC